MKPNPTRTVKRKFLAVMKTIPTSLLINSGYYITFFCILFSCLVSHGATNDEIVTDEHEYTIRYWDKDPGKVDKFTSQANAQRVADHFDPVGGDGLHDHLIDFGFPEVRPGRRDVNIERALAGAANTIDRGRIKLTPSSLLDRTNIISPRNYSNGAVHSLCAHELFHLVQYEIMDWGVSGVSRLAALPVLEGTAVAMEDAFPLTDNMQASPTGFYRMSAFYLDDLFDEYFWDYEANGRGRLGGYHQGLFWKYLMEQFGTVRDEPNLGVDFVKDYWEDTAEINGVVTNLRKMFEKRDRHSTAAVDFGVLLEEVFQDFAIANWVRRYRDPGASSYSIEVEDPARFYYADEDPDPTTSTRSISGDLPTFSLGGGGLITSGGPSPSFDTDFGLGVSSGLRSESVEAWASKYLRLHLNAPHSSGDLISFRGQAASPDKVWFSVIGWRLNGEIDYIEKGTVLPESGNSFSCTLLQDSVNPYIQVVAVATGGERRRSKSEADFDFEFEYTSPTVDILEPNTSYLAYVGDGAEPERFIAKVRVTTPLHASGGSVKGLTAEHFEVFVGSSSYPAPVISAAYVMGEYWLTCQAPARQPSPIGAQNLIVQVGSASQTKQEVVLYEDLEVDQMLVIDYSGSMGRLADGARRIDLARSAAQLFIDASGSDDQIGVVRFNGNGSGEPDSTDDADVVYGLQQMTSQFERDLVNLSIDQSNPAGDLLSPDGNTSIGDGLYWGARELIDNGKPQSEKWIILLSDGHQNEQSAYEDQKTLLENNGIRVETIALGDRVDKNLLQTIANNSSGRYYEVSESSAGGSSLMAPVFSLSDEGSSFPGSSPPALGALGSESALLNLSDRYLLSSDRIHRRERLFEKSGTLSASSSDSISFSIEEGGLADCVVTFVVSGSGADPEMVITRPGGAVVPSPDAGYTAASPDGSGHWWDPDRHVNYRLGSMEQGDWVFGIENNSSVSQEYLFVVSGRNREGVQSTLYCAQFHDVDSAYADNGLFLRGLPQPLTLVLTDGNGPVLGAEVLATVSHPNRIDTVLRLRDDGGSHDGAAGDGVYSAVFTATTEASSSGGGYAEEDVVQIAASYEVTVNSSGTDNLGRAFSRVDRAAFQLYSDQEIAGDSDNDGMPDTYEDLHYPDLDKSTADSDQDCDGDGLLNIEEYQAGTNPCNADTDGGGDTDKSEIDTGTNPFDYTDDALEKPLVAQVVESWGHIDPPLEEFQNYQPQSEANIIIFPLERGFDQVELHRSTSSAGPFSKVTTIDTDVDEGIYIDSGLVNGTTYYYRIRPLTDAGRIGTFSHIFSGTPRAESQPPEGILLINNNASHTSMKKVTLELIVSDDTTEMRFANDPEDLDVQPWIPFASTVFSYSLGSPAAGADCVVYCGLRDAAGNESLLASTTVYLPSTFTGRFSGAVSAPGDYGDAYTIVQCTDASSGESYPHYTDSTGSFDITLPAGTWDIEISRRGFEPVSFVAQTLTSSSSVSLGNMTLTPLDSDEDSINDIAELKDYDTNRFASDTDGDGYGDGVEILVLMTDPNDSNSLLRIGSLDSVDTSTGEVTITFGSVAGVQYRFLLSDDLDSWNYAEEDGSTKTLTATSSSTTVTLQGSVGTRQFIRVEAFN